MKDVYWPSLRVQSLPELVKLDVGGDETFRRCMLNCLVSRVCICANVYWLPAFDCGKIRLWDVWIGKA